MLGECCQVTGCGGMARKKTIPMPGRPAALGLEPNAHFPIIKKKKKTGGGGSGAEADDALDAKDLADATHPPGFSSPR